MPNVRKATKVSVNIWIERDTWARFAALVASTGARPRTYLAEMIERESVEIEGNKRKRKKEEENGV